MYKIISHHKDIDRVLKDFKELLFSELLEDSDKERLKITFNSLWACGQEEVNLFKGLKEVRNRKDEKILVVLNKIDVFPNIDEENQKYRQFMTYLHQAIEMGYIKTAENY